MSKKVRIIVFMGSKKDFPFAEKIGKFIVKEGFSVKFEYNVVSAHKTTDLLIRKLEEHDKSWDDLVYITIAGLSDALSGVVAGFTRYPVIACPPDSEKLGWSKIFSSVMTPTGVPVLFVSKPENAVLGALRILALANNFLYKEIDNYKSKKKEEIINADEDIKNEEKNRY